MTPLKQQISLFILGFRLVLPSGEHVLGLGLGLLLSSGERGGRDANFVSLISCSLETRPPCR